MKNKVFTILMLIAAVLTVSFSGCLGNDDNNFKTEEADVRSVTLSVENDNVTAFIVTELDIDESLDTANITVNQSGNTIRIYVPAVSPLSAGLENKVDVNIGKVNQFNNGQDFTVIVNNEFDRNEKAIFRIENDTFVTFGEAVVRSVSFKLVGTDVVAVAEFSVTDEKNVTVDTQNITVKGFDNDNEMDIYLPLIIKGNTTAGQPAVIQEEITVGPLSQFKDGRYSVDINDRENSFVIRDGVLVSSFAL